MSAIYIVLMYVWFELCGCGGIVSALFPCVVWVVWRVWVVCVMYN